MSALFLGVDGGGTKTEFVCLDEAGVQVASATLGTTYHVEVGFAEAVRRLAEGLDTICRALGAAPADIAHVFFGLPGFGEDRVVDPLLHTACGALLGHDRYACGNDMVCGWAGSLGCEDGINVVAGTGSIGYGERQGRRARAGGWGQVFGDEGSAYWIAVRGLAVFARMSDGRAAIGPLHAMLADELALSDDLDVCERVMGADALSRSGIAALAPVVTAAAEAGDELATAILAEAAVELAALVHALRRRLGFPTGECVRVSYSGGILVRVDAIRRRFEQLLGDAGDYETVTPRYSPAHGAALYARREAGRRARAVAPAAKASSSALKG